MQENFLILSFAFCLLSTNALSEIESDGHLKYRFDYSQYPKDSIYRSTNGNSRSMHGGNFRFNIFLTSQQENLNNQRNSSWSLETHYNLSTRYGDFIEISEKNELPFSLNDSIPNDDARLFNLNRVISDKNNSNTAHRLDRLAVAYRNESSVLKVGRQAISWGNGLIFSPMDFFNPFDPSLIDKEYKPGDDMVYAQHLLSNGNDIQLVYVSRRNDQNKIDKRVSSSAFKFHGFIGEGEVDLLAAEHFDDTVLAVGGSHSLGGSVLRGDIVQTRTKNYSATSVVASLSYSWLAWNKNMSGIIEFFHNGFGIANGDYSAQALQDNSALLDRVLRGEIFSLGKNYLAASTTLELTPLWIVRSNIFHNLSDDSSLLQCVSQYDIGQNMQWVNALTFPIGEVGSEYGGIMPAGADQYLKIDTTMYTQLAWYF